MPSWNIHTAHVERLLQEREPLELGIHDVNAFLFGNFLPDVPVGFIVPVEELSRKVRYHETHFAERGVKVPVPRAYEFAERYVRPGASDVTLGAWAHLICDSTYNERTVALLARLGLENNDVVRIRKQTDFDIFGRSLGISMLPELTDELVAQCAAFEQYPLTRGDVEAGIRAAKRLFDATVENPVEEPVYDLLDDDFLEGAFEEAHRRLLAALARPEA